MRPPPILVRAGGLLDSPLVSGSDGIVAETARLRLRRLRPSDLDVIAAMVADPEQMRHYPAPRSRDEARAWLDRNLAVYDRHGHGTWYLEFVQDGGFAGYCGIRPLELDGRTEMELGWHVLRTHWNQGLATEAATAAMELGFGRFGLRRLVAIIHPDNAASRAVARKLGMQEEGPTTLEGEPYVLYGVDVSL